MNILSNFQSGNLKDYTIVVKEEDEEYGVMEEFSERHKDMMEPPNTRNPPERCPRPLYSQDSTQEDHNYAKHYQNRNLGDDNIIRKEDHKEEDEEYGAMKEFPEVHKDIMEPLYTRNPSERCPRPLYFWDSTQEDHTIPHHYKGEDLINIKVEGKAEEERDNQQSVKEDGITGTFIEEDTPTEISTGGSLTLNTFLHPYCSLIGPE
ncbi:hypothetical protein AB205_0042220 [Aquarana catesbeiana]|uniref:Uncharacterized protein n=1 Tax=Aquarana catesbeiana TaxID=8400 RepID=A0A2G9Q7I2_AQUCT|nr:hypothetical protein AB205_0042220 [Aquarana catesbeiana]